MAKKERLKAEGVKITTPEFRMSFPTLFEPRAAEGSDKKKYSVTMQFQIAATEKSKAEGRSVVDIQPLRDAVKAVLVEKYGADTTKWPAFGDGKGLIKLPFRSGTEQGKADSPGLGEGIIFVQASKNGDQIRPGVVDGSLKPITIPSDVYGGCYGRATINPYFWEFMGKFGVSFGLQNVQLIRDGERFGGGEAATDAFDAIPTPGGAQAVGAGAGAGKSSDPLGL